MTIQTPSTIRRLARNTWRTSDTSAALDLFLKHGFEWLSVRHSSELARLVKAGARVTIRHSGHIVVAGADPGHALALLDAAERSVTQ